MLIFPPEGHNRKLSSLMLLHQVVLETSTGQHNAKIPLNGVSRGILPAWDGISRSPWNSLLVGQLLEQPVDKQKHTDSTNSSNPYVQHHYYSSLIKIAVTYVDMWHG